MDNKQNTFQTQAGLVRSAIPGYRILRRVVELQRGGTVSVRHAGDKRRAEPDTYPLAAE